MQLMIDLNVETSAALRLAAQFLTDNAALKDALERGEVPAAQGAFNLDVPAGTPPLPAHLNAQGDSVSIPTPPAPPAPPAPNNVVSFPSTSTTGAPSGSTSPTSPPSADEYDSAGVPWDARIHQSGKSKKKDLTWKLKRGIEDAVVTSVMQELFATGRIRKAADPLAGMPAPNTGAAVFGQSPLPPGVEVPASSFPGAVPMPPVAGVPAADGMSAPSGQSVPVPPAPADGGVSAPLPPVSLQHSAVPVPPAPNVGMPDANGSQLVQTGLDPSAAFRQLVGKITALRTAGKLTADQVTACVVQAGAPSLQALGSMAHLVPTVDTLIDATVAGM